MNYGVIGFDVSLTRQMSPPARHRIVHMTLSHVMRNTLFHKGQALMCERSALVKMYESGILVDWFCSLALFYFEYFSGYI